jgi:hypothetical protein
MIPSLILIGLLVAVGLVLYLLDRYRSNDDVPSPPTADAEPQTGCNDAKCVLRETCPSEQLLRGACEEKIVYYDDEELDAFKGRNPDEYTDADIEQFRDVIYTLRRDELMPWYQSISRRGIKLTDGLYRELVALASE